MRNQNNQNVQWISTEARDDGRNINIVMREGAKTGTDAVRQDPMQHKWVKKILNHGSSLMHGKKRRHSRRPDRILSSRMLCQH
jgi:hypothetical protein